MPLLTQFVREVRTLADASEKRVGHPIRLAHRLPAHPESCLALGFDPVTWGREGLADMVTLSSFCGGANFDYPARIWRAMLGENVTLTALADAAVQPYPEQVFQEYEFLYGAAASALERGVDGVYLFNQNYCETDDPGLLAHMLRHLGSLETLAGCRRRPHPQRDADSAARAGNRRQFRANGGEHHPEDQRWTETGYRTRRACPGLWPRHARRRLRQPRGAAQHPPGERVRGTGV